MLENRPIGVKRVTSSSPIEVAIIAMFGHPGPCNPPNTHFVGRDAAPYHSVTPCSFFSNLGQTRRLQKYKPFSTSPPYKLATLTLRQSPLSPGFLLLVAPFTPCLAILGHATRKTPTLWAIAPRPHASCVCTCHGGHAGSHGCPAPVRPFL